MNIHTRPTMYMTNVPEKRQIVEGDKIDTTITQMHDCSLSWIFTGTSIRK